MEKNVSASTQEKPSKLQASASNQRGKSENPDEPNKNENQMKVESQPKSGSQFNKVTENSTLKPSPFCQQDCNRLTLSKSLKSVNTLGENDVNGNHVNIDQVISYTLFNKSFFFYLIKINVLMKNQVIIMQPSQ